ncbi:DUF6452 family protein [Winogradskyella pulchriflava]|uniref:DUF6452 family protein n=1 Tax=Winogradskyella pulchriflava TaxID=1110688 RepID=A0ABV6Q9A2_9FLAO
MRLLLKTKYYTFLILGLIVLVTLQNCERDDICAESTTTTSRLIIEFYDTDNPEELKSVPNLTVYGEGLITDENGSIIEPTEASDKIITRHDDDDAYVFNITSNKIALPLRINDDLGNDFVISRFVLEKDTDLRLDDDGTTDSSTDIIEITYNTEFEYVSRACGYKSIFELLNITLDTGGDTWIDNIEIVETTINNENTVHVNIFH